LAYIHELKNWPEFQWDKTQITKRVIAVTRRQGHLLGQMEGLGFKLRAEAVLQTLTEEVLKTSEIEGDRLDRGQVRSSIARHMGMEIAGLTPSDRHVDSVVEMMLDATQKYSAKLTEDRIFGWHAVLFPTGRSGMSKIRVAAWRNDSDGPMQVVSGPIGKRKVHFEAPSAKRISAEIKRFLKWFNAKDDLDWIIKSGVAHFWFVTLHPFDDGNGRISRAIADLALARSEGSAQRFYSMSAQICAEREAYYNILESSQKGRLDITDWLIWYLDCLERAIVGAEKTLAQVFKRSRFWEAHASATFNDRQRKMINHLMDGFEGKLTSSKWAKICKVSQDTAARDIEALVEAGILEKNPEGGRSTSYSLA
jgi:Fic family protein